MQPLDKILRKRLERTVNEARDSAEDGARAVLEQLGVGTAAPFSHLSERERELRRRLRVHGRQLGDTRYAKSELQEIDRLIEEVAYEHWHRMLFARFLAENNLLMYPDQDEPVAVTLEECEDLAADAGTANGWELAAHFAARMLPQIFQLDSPVFQLVLPPEHQQKLERLVANLPLEVFRASDSLGWVYQFWQGKKKDEVNAAEGKIGARELPAVTQLFTEPYMVSFLLDNSLGAWWAARRLSDADLKNASSEEELRQKAAIPGVPLAYLRFVQLEDPEGKKSWRPAAGTFNGWPEQLADLKTLDPCCGSGHFLVAALLMLTPMRMERDGLSAKEAVDAVLRENIHGLELDQRCVELAAFALALAAWKYPGAGGYRLLPELSVACSGLPISAKKEEWLALAGENTNLGLALEELYEQFKDAPLLGSLINPEASLGKGTLFELNWDDICPLLNQALSGERDVERTEMGIVASGLAKAAKLLADRWHWVVTNVPYLGRGKQNDLLKAYIAKYHNDAKQDLATAFIDRSICFSGEGGSVGIVCPQNWLSRPVYSIFRRRLLETIEFNILAKLGPRAFETISGEVVNVALVILSKSKVNDDHKYGGIDVTSVNSIQGKAKELTVCSWQEVRNIDALNSPDSRISLEARGKVPTLGKIASSPQGIKTGDDFRFRRNLWEVSIAKSCWKKFQSSPESNEPYGGMCYTIAWNNEGKDFARLQGQAAWNHRGAIIRLMGGFKFSIYSGDLFDSNVTAIIPQKELDQKVIWSFCLSEEFKRELGIIEDGIQVNNATVVKVPFDFSHWSTISDEQYPNGLPKPYTNDPSQWIFHGHPCGSVVWSEEKRWTTHAPLRLDDSVLQVAVARLLGYRWPAELDPSMELADEQREWVKR